MMNKHLDRKGIAMVEIKLLKDNSEIVPYNFPYFPVHARKDWLSYYPNMTIVSHWHADIEFIVILQGKMYYSVDGKDFLLEEGQCIFVNSRHLHYGYPFEGEDCQFLCLVFHPSLLNFTNRIKETYVDIICKNPGIPFFIFNYSESWQKEVIIHLKQIYEICQKKIIGFELAVLSKIYSLWLIIIHNMKNIEMKGEFISDKRLETLYSMIDYIQNHYSEKLTLNHIATAGNVCRSSCCQIFSNLLNMTPIKYLTSYRLEKSIEFLYHATYSITDIALLCGFNSSSYFTEVFRRELGCTPSEYKDKIKTRELTI